MNKPPNMVRAVDFHCRCSLREMDMKICVVFRNDDFICHEGVFFFRTTANLNVYAVRVKNNDNVSEGMFLSRHEAQQRYSRAIEENRPAGKLTSYPYHVWELSINFIEPGVEIPVEIYFTGPLYILGGYLRIVLPLTIVHNMPINTSPDRFHVLLPEFLEKVDYDCSIELDIETKESLLFNSPTHEIRCEKQEKKTIVSLPGRVMPDRDFVLKIGSQQTFSNFCAAQRNSDGTLAARLQLGVEMESFFSMTQEIGQELIFIIPLSASITAKARLLQRRILEKTLRLLTENDFCNVLCAASSMQWLFPQSVPVTEENINRIFQLLPEGDFSYEPGGDIASILEAAYRCPAPSSPVHRSFLLLGNGGHWCPGRLYPLLKSHPAVRIFSIGVGEASYSSALCQFSFLTRGMFEFVRSPTEINAAVVAQLNRIVQPEAKNIRITIDRGELLLPALLPTIYDGDRWDFYFRILGVTDSAHITVEYQLGPKTYTHTFEVKVERDDSISPGHKILQKIFPFHEYPGIQKDNMKCITRPQLNKTLYAERIQPYPVKRSAYPSTIVTPLMLPPGSIHKHLNIYELFNADEYKQK